jgi:hypothetical protein
MSRIYTDMPPSVVRDIDAEIARRNAAGEARLSRAGFIREAVGIHLASDPELRDTILRDCARQGVNLAQWREKSDRFYLGTHADFGLGAGSDG